MTIDNNFTGIHRLIEHLRLDTALYTTAFFRYRDEVVATSGENHPYHAGADLGDGLHGGAISAAIDLLRKYQAIACCDDKYSS